MQLRVALAVALAALVPARSRPVHADRDLPPCWRAPDVALRAAHLPALPRTRPVVRWVQRVGVQTWRNRAVFVGDRVLVSSAGDAWNEPDARDGVACYALADGRLLWSERTSADANELAVLGDLVVVGTDAGEVVAVPLDGPPRRWTAHLRGRVYARPAAQGDSVLAVTGSGDLRRLSRASGATEASYDVGAGVRSGMALEGDDLYVATEAARVLRFDVARGLELVREVPAGLTGSLSRTLGFYAEPLVLPDRVVLGVVRDTYEDAPALLALDRDLARVAWTATHPAERATFGNVRVRPEPYEDLLLVANPYSNDVLAVGARDGVVRWRRALGRPMFQQWSAPVVDGDMAVVARHDGFLHRLRAADGALAWSLDLGSLDAPPRAYRAGDALPGADEGPDWTPPDGRAALFATPAVRGRSIVVGTGDGRLVVVEDVPE